MTTCHKHRIVKVPSWSAWYVRALRWGILHTRNLLRVEASPYPYGPCPKRGGPCKGHEDCWTLSALSILHRWTGLTLYHEKPDEEEGAFDDGNG